MKELTVYIDGASKGNPGKASIGLIIYSDKTLLKKVGASIGEATNNVAEYIALIIALIECLRYRPEKIEVRSDSQLLVRQMQGTYRVKDRYLQKLQFIATRLISLYNNVYFLYIPREENKEADKTAEDALKSG
ncbi:MAG TPA: ribonuclease HI family protein [bacterium]|nr:ribonuclease HI family protein [bacterium]HPP30447.1 ribonuclease HI family protein [bacterium]